MKKAFCLILSIMLIIGLAACQSSPKPEDTVKKYFEAGKSFDTERMNSFVNSKNVSSESSSSSASSDSEEADLVKYCMDYLKGNAKKVTYSIKGSDIKDATATVTVDCKYVDGSAILRDSVSDYIVKAVGEAFSGTQNSSNSSKEIAQIMTDKMKTTKEIFTTKTIKINCVKINDKWCIDKVNDDLSDVFLSGFVSAGNEISESFDNSDSSESDSSSSNASQAESVKNKLSEIDDYIISDIWNKGFCNINSYLTEGKGSTGESLDIDFTLQQLDDAMKKKTDYDTYISKLDGNKYSKVKSIWEKLSPEIDVLYKSIKAKKPIANSNTSFDTGKFQQYRDAFSDAVDNIK